MMLLESKDMKKWLDQNNEKIGKDAYDQLYAYMLEWQILEKRCDRLFKIGVVESYGDILMDVPNKAFAEAFCRDYTLVATKHNG